MIRFLYIDDERSDTTTSIVELLKRSNSELEVIYQYPQIFAKQMIEITSGDYSGILLDFRLDQVVSPTGERVDFRAFSLAQEIRSRVVENNLPDMPIILCSTASKMCNSLKSDETSKDLFDLFVDKDTLTENKIQIAMQMISLASGYKQIKNWQNAKKPWHVLLDVEKEFFSNLNPGIWSNFDEPFDQYSPHKFARFFLNELAGQTGPLIDERILAARLGVNKNENTKEWLELLGRLHSLKYSGPFCEGWKRWWAKKLENWWKSQKDCPGNLRNLSAKERVAFLNRTFGLNFQPSEPIEKNYSDNFWTICLGTGKPLDPLDGLIAAGPDLKPWQEMSYLSIKAALERTGYQHGVRVHSIEKERFNDIKAALDE